MKKLENYKKENIMFNGLKATIINFRRVHDIDIMFENGVEVLHKDYYKFLDGNIKCPMIYNCKNDYVECINPNTKDAFYISKEDLNKIKQIEYWHIDKTNGYVKNSKSIYLHRYIMDCKKGMYIDHINHNKLDNRRSNLRVCTSQENNFNSITPKNSSTGYKGITKRGNKYRVKIAKDGNQICLGTYDNIDDAISQYNKHAKLLFVEFAYFNWKHLKNLSG